MIPSEPEERDILAGEYVLGQLDAEATADFESALASDSDLARRVAFWESAFLPATGALTLLPVDPVRWVRIEREVTSRIPTRAALQPEPETAAPSLARRTWRNAALWRATTGLATAAAIALAILPRTIPPESPTRYYAILQARDATGQEAGPGWIIQIEQDGTLRSLPLSDVTPGSGHALQLWTLWDKTRGPVSLGLLPPGGAVRLPPERLETIGSDQLFEITLEPEAGSPTGRPTGRVLFIGRTRGAAVQSL